MPISKEQPAPGPAPRIALLLGLAAGTVLLLLPWWRNHAILRDFCDYGLVVAGAGRWALGDQPYVDFLTPIQTLVFSLARAAEAVFGPHYLALTYANAVFIAAGFTGMAVLLARPLGSFAALLVAAAVVTASAGQHTILWYNPLGTAWVALVVCLAAPPGGTDRTGRLVLVCLFLWLGGMTKLTYQATALAFAGLFALRDGWIGGLPWRRVGVKLAAYTACGLAAPLATELLLTGATMGQWLQNVVLMPATRAHLLQALLTPDFYLHTPHDYYAPLYFPFAGAWGLGVLALLGALAGWSVRRSDRRGRAWLLLAVMVAGSVICGGVLLATNFDIAYLAGAMWLVLGTALVLALPGATEGRAARPLRLALGLAALSLLLPAWQASWNGTRALWGHVALVRSELRATDDLPRFAYFQGLRVPGPIHESMAALARSLDELAAEGLPARAIYFANATEWMVRAVPEARHRGLPLWLHEGTTFGEPEARVINRLLGAGDDIQAVFSLEAWNVWLHGMDWYLAARYRHHRVGPLFHLYRLKGGTEVDWRNPLTFATTTASTAFARDLVTTGGPFELSLRPGGSVLGTRRSGVLEIGAPLARLQAGLVVRRITRDELSPQSVAWRIVADSPSGASPVLQEGRVALAPRQLELTVELAAAPAGRRVALELDLPPDGSIEAGIRKLQTDYLPGTDGGKPNPLDRSLALQSDPGNWRTLFVPGSLPALEFAGAGLSVNPITGETGWHLFAHSPSEVWFRPDPAARRLAGEFGVWSAAWENPDALPGVIARVISYRPGRLEVLFERVLRPLSVEQDRAPQPFAAALPPGSDWIGLVITPVDPGRNAYGHSWWRRVRAW